MRKATLLTFLTLVMALPALADRERHQSFISYDDGGTVIRQGDDDHEVEARRNLPVYPGDEIVTARRGRAEVRLSDGNIVGIDRATALRFRSILDSYEGDSNETVAELRYGKIAVYRTDIGQDHVRLDTENASYVAEDEAVYSVETDSNGRDRVTVFDGSVDVRTQRRSSRLREGESATVDDRGVYDVIGDQRSAADDFERWFLRRAEKFENYNNRYVDRRLGYWTDDLDDYGSWVFVSGIGYSWRPFVSVGWRPYYNGYWHSSRHGCLTWVSYDPWGWGPYHYGRWAYDAGYGWVWVPGSGYSPAWVYWWYGPSYIGWAPAGWWDCHRGYYDWAYRPYRNRDWGAGFYGRVRIAEMDLRPWTFVDSGSIISNRIDRAALTTDAVKQRLGRSRDGYATVGSGSQRFTNEALRDPAEAIRRRGLDGRTTGPETGSGATIGADMTPFFRRDGNVSGTIRDRIVRSRGGSEPSTGSGSSTPTRTVGGGGIDRGTIGRGTATPIDRSDRGNNDNSSSTGRDTSWRGRGGTIGGGIDRSTTPTPSDTTTTERPRSSDTSWRQRPRTDDRPSTSSGSDSKDAKDSKDVPRRIIDRIGGARIYPRDTDRSTGSNDRGSSGSNDRGSSTRERERSSRSGDSGSRDSGSSTRSSGSRNDGGGSHNSGSSNNNSGRSSSGNSGGGRIKRD